MPPHHREKSTGILILLLLCLASGLAFGAGSADPAMLDGYHLRAGDTLVISVWKETELQSDVLIRPDGGISFALAGDLPAAGRTVAELTSTVQAKVRTYIPDAVVTIAVKTALGNQIFVIGKVNKPGNFLLTGPMDVMQALSVAGGATPFASTNSIRVLRRTGDRMTSIPFHYGQVARGRKLDQNILLQSGDTVVVP
jgi:polysaccharide export outer membrane protein